MVHPVVLDGEVVAVAGRRRCAVVADLEPATYRLVAAMCLFHREVAEGRVPGPFTSRRAEVWAHALLAAADSPAGPHST
jgi:hypothetical protein